MSKIVLVTGGGKGIGKAITTAFLNQGCELIIVSRNAESLRHVESEFSLPSYRLRCYEADVSDNDDVAEVVAEVSQACPRIDVLVNNVGGFYFQGILEQEHGQWAQMVNSNLHSVHNMVTAFYPLLQRSEHGRIINIAAAYASANIGLKKFGAYAALKAAVSTFSKSLAVESAADGITVNLVSPGMIDTGVYDEATIDKYSRLIPLGRFGMPEEVARAVTFLADEESDYITGAEIVVAGGWKGETE
jgi:NAD(P)-dependent dehydrogenase (short-subunit alcohol dehydrogenase family)